MYLYKIYLFPQHLLRTMLDNITIDQLRLFVAAAEEGSFSAAGRKLFKVQSAVSYGIANLEDCLGVELFDRTKRSPVLNDSGKVLLQRAKNILLQIDQLHNQAQSIQMGLESHLSVGVDVFFPQKYLIQLCKEFKQTYPNTPLEIYSEALGSSLESVIKKRCHIGLAGPLFRDNTQVQTYPLGSVLLITVVSQDHPLAFLNKELLSEQDLSEHIQIVLRDRTSYSAGQQNGILSTNTWSVHDLETKKSLIVGGLGWGNMPIHSITDEIRTGQLVRINPLAWQNISWDVPLYCIHRVDTPLGTAAHWFYKKAEQMMKK